MQVLFPFPTLCDCSRSQSHRGFSHSPIICCWTQSLQPRSANDYKKTYIHKSFTFFSVLPCRPHRWRHTSRHTSPPPSPHHKLTFSKGGRGGKNKVSTFLQGLTKTFLKSTNGSNIFFSNLLLQNFRTCIIIAYKIRLHWDTLLQQHFGWGISLIPWHLIFVILMSWSITEKGKTFTPMLKFRV